MTSRPFSWIAAIISLAIAITGVPPIARADTAPTFATIPWGSSDAIVKRTLEAKGFDFVKKDQDGDLDFKGNVNGKTVLVFELMTPSRQLVKAQVVFLTSDDEAIQYFHDFQETLVEKYGDPKKTFAFYQYPYNDDDSETEHEIAFRVGKATLSAFWTYDDGSGLWIDVTKRLTVEANYESAGWHAEVTRRESNGNSVF